MGEIGPQGDLVEIQEGLARILVPRGYTTRGPGGAGGVPFYNRAMAFPRHVSVLMVEALLPRARRVLDGLSSTGVLGIRLALEVTNRLEITMNERRGDSHRLMISNMKLNGLEDARALREDLNALLCLERFDYVDVDPFGSPVPFVDNALRSIHPRGFLALTATDTAALAGTYPRVCLRRYGARPLRAPISHEVGVRILAGYVVRTAAKYDMAARPLLCFWREHYYKAFFDVLPGARRADESISKLAYVRYDPGGPRDVVPQGPIGPLWAGPLHDAVIISSMRPRDYMPQAVSRYVEVWGQEALAPPLFYTTDELASRFRMQAPSMKRVIGILRDAGFTACRTTFHPKGFKTDAPWDELVRLLGAP
jgi:tRNA (guanine26-N2/guanine27-N2)-dimethyltransferase